MEAQLSKAYGDNGVTRFEYTRVDAVRCCEARAEIIHLNHILQFAICKKG